MSAVTRTGPAPRAGQAVPGGRSGTRDPAPRRPRRVDQAAGPALEPVVRTGRHRAVNGLGAAVAGSGTAYHVAAGNTAANEGAVTLLGVLSPRLVIGVVGVAFSGEYGTGMIRAALVVVPARLPVLWAKVIVLVGLVIPVTLLCAFADFFAAAAIESSRGVLPACEVRPAGGVELAAVQGPRGGGTG
ncbi:MAG: hypothetical protein M3Z75_30835 [Actinomycetota bacterium]|nr:hypothetical protein [Actinomycetota bacterium]